MFIALESPALQECASCIMSWFSFKDSLVSLSTEQVKSLNQSPEITAGRLTNEIKTRKDEVKTGLSSVSSPFKENITVK